MQLDFSAGCRKWHWIIGLLALMAIGWGGKTLLADPAQPVFQPDGSIKSTKATISMSDGGVITMLDNAGGTYSIFIPMYFRANGAYFTPANTTQTIKSFDSQTRTTSFYGVIVPPTGSVDMTPVPFCCWMHLKDDGEIRLGMEFYSDRQILDILSSVQFRTQFTPRSSLVGHYVMCNSTSYLISANDPSRSLGAGSINATFFSDVPDRCVRFYRVESGYDSMSDTNTSTTQLITLVYALNSGMDNRLLCDIALPDEPATMVPATPVFQSDGRIVAGQASMTMTNGEIKLIDSHGVTYSIHLSMYIRMIPPQSNPWFTCGTSQYVLSQVQTVDVGNKKTVFSGIITPPAGAYDTTPIPLVFWMQLQPSGKVRVQAEYTYSGSIYNTLSSALLKSMNTPRGGYVGHTIWSDGVDHPVLNEPPDGNNTTVFDDGSIQEVRFMNDSPLDRIVMEKVTSEYEQLKDYNGVYATPYIQMLYQTDRMVNRVAMDVTFPQVSTNSSTETYGGVDFWYSDTLRMPSYGKSVNLVSNPSFEHDFHYWRWNAAGSATASAVSQQYQIDATTAYQGNRSLKLIGKQNQTVAQLTTFAMPVDSGQTYTLSFYAKTDNTNAARLHVSGVTAIHPIWIPGLPTSLPLTTGWQRYAYTFTVPNGLAAIGFTLTNPSQDCHAWIDAVQLEKASTATAFVQRAVTMSLVTDHMGNLFQPGETPISSVRITGASNTSGTLKVYVCDFSGNEIKKQTSNFTVGSNGETSISQTWTASMLQGVYVVRMESQIGSTLYRDFSRIAVMPSVSLVQTGRSLFAMNGSVARFGDWARQLDFYSKLGMGSLICFDPAPTALQTLFNQYQITQFSSIFEGGENIASLGIALRTDYDLTPTELAALQTYAYNKALANPQITYWKLMNEPPTSQTDATHMGQMLTTLQAAATGIKQANPQAKIITNDPANMNTASGIPYINSFLQYGGSSFCDIVGIHPYRSRPEMPDLDADCASLMQTLQNRNFTGDVWFTEGICHQNYILPAYGLNSNIGLSSDAYRGGPFSYDMGWGERMCAAHMARSWLTAMKYGDRVKLYVDWNSPQNMSLDYGFTPCAAVFSVNTLVRTLGGATYQGQATIDSGIRCYVFTDANGYQVAAIWYFSDPTDMGQSVPGTLDVSVLLSQYQASDMELVDFTGNIRPLPAIITIEPWPVFIRIRTGTSAQLIDALNQAIFNQDYAP